MASYTITLPLIRTLTVTTTCGCRTLVHAIHILAGQTIQALTIISACSDDGALRHAAHTCACRPFGTVAVGRTATAQVALAFRLSAIADKAFRTVDAIFTWRGDTLLAPISLELARECIGAVRIDVALGFERALAALADEACVAVRVVGTIGRRALIPVANEICRTLTVARAGGRQRAFVTRALESTRARQVGTAYRRLLARRICA